MQSEVTVTVKGEDSTFKKKFLEYDVIVLDESDKRLQAMIENTLAEYKGIPEEISLKFRVEWLNPIKNIA